MRSTQQRQKFPSTDPKKTITILKCFLCNQLFYAQNAFDAHMKQHQSKINRNIPQEIQRRTMDSFRNKQKSKNNKSTLLPVQGNSITIPPKQQKIQSKITISSNQIKQIKKILPSISSKKLIEKKEDDNDQFDKKQYQNVDDLLQESINLMNKISFLTQQTYQEKDESIKQSQQQIQKERENQKRKRVINKNMNQNEFQRSIINELKQCETVKIENIEYLFLRTNFYRSQWKSYQQQYEYLEQLQQEMRQYKNIYIKQDISSKNSIKNMRSGKDLSPSYTKVPNESVGNNIMNIKQKILSKIVQQIRQQIKIKDKIWQRKQNDIMYCSECYCQILIVEDYEVRMCGHVYHKECGIQNPKCCNQ